MRALFAIGTAVLTLSLASPVCAQDVFVTDRNGQQTRGLILRTSASELTLLVDGKEQVVPSSQIGRIEKRDSLWNGLLVGAAPFALLGGAVAGASCSPHCGRDIPLGMLVFGAIGSGIGALIDSRSRGYAIVDGPSLASRNARRTPAPVTEIADLWQRVRQGDSIEVVMRGGQQIAGRFERVSDAFVTLTVDGTRREIPSSDVRRVTRSEIDTAREPSGAGRLVPRWVSPPPRAAAETDAATRCSPGWYWAPRERAGELSSASRSRSTRWSSAPTAAQRLASRRCWGRAESVRRSRRHSDWRFT